MRYQGRLQDWNDEKGYGFVTPNGGGERAFVHIKAFEHRPQRPANGTLISYEPRKDERGRINARAVRLVTPGKAQASAKSSRSTRPLPRTALGMVVLFATVAVWGAGFIPDWTMVTIIGLSLLAMVFYVSDKAAAQRNRWRTPESTLHLIALLGGWPGALLAQGLFNHKVSKPSFQRTFWMTVFFNLIGLIVLIKVAGDWLPKLF
ncbi:cold shock and DUF1294 domain-containing protein [Stenotrophomonas sp. SY1]|uniref:DUF1294 domain-containing protein n=1 Tax=Stenotrophomonas sp. SY1 TaxID=477235 RepID=UPI001E395AFD|nr:cold shock and DUF1294 domain-containing protein [Stenotrophomonas sp. SY1]MCD9086763.1 cold shock and DUF1294 domain-containing protein [Stenotrophomonas sp. SY1]